MSDNIKLSDLIFKTAVKNFQRPLHEHFQEEDRKNDDLTPIHGGCPGPGVPDGADIELDETGAMTHYLPQSDEQ